MSGRDLLSVGMGHNTLFLKLQEQDYIEVAWIYQCYLHALLCYNLFPDVRLIHTCLSHEKLRPIWLSVIEQSPDTYQALLLILQGSANGERPTDSFFD